MRYIIDGGFLTGYPVFCNLHTSTLSGHVEGANDGHVFGYLFLEIFDQ